MKLSIKILLSVFLLAGVSTSCIKDKGNYDYTEIQKLRMEFEKDSIIVSNGSVVTITPRFIDEITGEEVEVNYDDYSYDWRTLEYAGSTNIAYTKDRKVVSDKYNLDAMIVLPVRAEYHTISLEATNKATGQVYNRVLKVRTIDAFTRAYAFLTEDDERNVELEFYGWDIDDNVVHMKDYLASADYPFTHGGANGIEYDKNLNRLYIATGEKFSWLNTPNMTYDPVTNDIEKIMFPNPVQTFSKIVRIGTTGSAVQNRTFVCFTESGELHLLNTKMQPSIAIRGIKPVEVAPMVGGMNAVYAAFFWDKTNKALVHAGIGEAGMTNMSRSLSPFDTGISTAIDDCLYLGARNSQVNGELLAVLKDVEGKFWRVYGFGGYDGVMAPYLAIRRIASQELIGTAALGTIDHWFNVFNDSGYLYVVANNAIYYYVESQAGGVEDPGWTKVNITDKTGATVNITDPISFVYKAANHDSYTNDLRTCFYVVTYNAGTKSSTVYRLNSIDTGYNLRLLEKFEGLGNVKQMCYWWG